MNKEDLIKELERLPDQIERVMYKIYELEILKEDIDKKYNSKKTKVIEEVYSATDNNGKKLFTNQQQRDIEVDKRMRNFRENSTREMYISEIRKMKIALEYLKYRFKAMKYIALLMGGKDEL